MRICGRGSSECGGEWPGRNGRRRTRLRRLLLHPPGRTDSWPCYHARGRSATSQPGCGNQLRLLGAKIRARHPRHREKHHRERGSLHTSRRDPSRILRSPTGPVGGYLSPPRISTASGTRMVAAGDIKVCGPERLVGIDHGPSQTGSHRGTGPRRARRDPAAEPHCRCGGLTQSAGDSAHRAFTGKQGDGLSSAAVLSAPIHPDGGGGIGPSHRLRECGQSPAGPGYHPPKRNCHAARSRFGPPPAGPPVADGERAASCPGRDRGPLAGVLGQQFAG
jgi:hypothetical protein